MTGFARRDGAAEGWRWVWELRSVNGKGLDVRLRLPSGADALEQPARSLCQKRLGRGNVSVSLQLEFADTAAGYAINRDWLATLIEAARDASGDGAVDVAALMQVRGVIDSGQAAEDPETLAARDAAIGESLSEAVEALAAARAEEGARLQEILSGVVSDIEALIAAAADAEAARPAARRQRLQTLLKDLLEQDPPLTEDRLAQELALQMTRGDVTEELDRLRAHVQQARELLASKEPVGRRLDFLAQEFNREANTLCSKSSDVQLTRIGMDMKVAIDRLREQVQNIE
ncbi:MAG: YicC/YloC family endoribonuclease [Minwuia sp.]|uniref:YicC/YloC family endoribonuclease n=1 Tax=Minwuia sp. TaxID=2493630 RepID=UPI003A8BA5BE